jgi:hypothetical protein
MAIFVGIFQVELHLHAAQSLKEKRFVLNSLKARIANKFNVSIAEVDHNDLWQRATIGMALVANERKFIDEAFAKILNALDGENDCEVIRHQLEVV